MRKSRLELGQDISLITLEVCLLLSVYPHAKFGCAHIFAGGLSKVFFTLCILTSFILYS